MQTASVAILGLGFGAEFIPIYQAYPNAEMYAICRRNETELNKYESATKGGAIIELPAFTCS